MKSIRHKQYIQLIHVANVCLKWDRAFFQLNKYKKSIKNALLSLNQSKEGRWRETARPIRMVHIFSPISYFQNSVFDKLHRRYFRTVRCLHKMNIKMDFIHKHNMILWLLVLSNRYELLGGVCVCVRAAKPSDLLRPLV